MDWTDPKTNEITTGFKEKGFLPEAFVNMLAMLGWNDGTDHEIFSLTELVEKFSMERVHKSGAKFDYEKAKWYNGEWIKKLPVSSYKFQVAELLENIGIIVSDDEKFEEILELIKDRCTLLNDFVKQGSFFFQFPEMIDIAAINPNWNEQKNLFFLELIRAFELMQSWNHEALENELKELAAANQLKPGELMLPLRIMLVGGKFGPHVFNIAEVLGKEETIKRIQHTLQLLSK